MSETKTNDTERVEKTFIGLPSAQKLGNFGEEVALAAVDSVPKLDQSTVRIESVTPLDSGNYETVISGELQYPDRYDNSEEAINETNTGTEHDINIYQHNIDHLRDGQPVFKGIDEDIRVVLRPVHMEENND